MKRNWVVALVAALLVVGVGLGATLTIRAANAAPKAAPPPVAYNGANGWAKNSHARAEAVHERLEAIARCFQAKESSTAGHHERGRLLQTQPLVALQLFTQSFTPQQLHDEHRRVRLEIEDVQHLDDVRMLQRARSRSFAQEAFAQLLLLA